MTDAEKLAELKKWARSFRNRCTQDVNYLTILKRCDAIILCGDWQKSMGCMQEYAAAYVLGIPAFEFNETGIIEVK